MSDIDLTEAVEAAARAQHDGCGCIESGSPVGVWAKKEALVALTAALPHIERQVREQVAREIEARLPDADSSSQRVALYAAASIARGDS